VLLMVRRSTSSTAHAAGLTGAMVGPATQYGDALFNQKTSLQQVDIPRFEGISRNCVKEGVM
jgi:hypothetical protein